MKTKFFNTTGPCNSDYHYILPPSDRLVGAQLNRNIRDKLYWVLHVPRQTGKTTFLQRVLNGGGNIERECAAGRGRMDLLVEYEEYKYIIEIKF